MSVFAAHLFCVVFLVSALRIACDLWDFNNDPRLQWYDNLNYKLSSLPRANKLATCPWSDTYWPCNVGGVASRWQMNEPAAYHFSYVPLTLAQLKASTATALNLLSPAEKIDILARRYDYPTVKAERARCEGPSTPSWVGICDGWSMAAIQFRTEPKPVTFSNSDGITVHWARSDITGALAWFKSQYDNPTTYFMGTRCNTAGDLSVSPDCTDINAGSWHVALGNGLGKGLPFAIDIDPSIEVWNQPLCGYTCTNVLSQYSCTITYTDELNKPATQLTPAKTHTILFEYNVQTSGGNIIGGSWNTYARPDFAWNQTYSQPYGYFSSLWRLYEKATRPSTSKREANVQEEGSMQAIQSPPPMDGHVLLPPHSGKFGLHGPYDRYFWRASWSIPVEQGETVTLVLEHVRMQKWVDALKVYEELDGSGPLMMLSAGNHTTCAVRCSVKITYPGAMVVFKTRFPTAMSPNTGFDAHYWGSKSP